MAGQNSTFVDVLLLETVMFIDFLLVFIARSYCSRLGKFEGVPG